MTTVDDVERRGKCVNADRVPCEKARKYLDKKGLICKTPPPKPRPARAARVRSPGFFDQRFDALGRRLITHLDNLLAEWFLPRRRW